VELRTRGGGLPSGGCIFLNHSSTIRGTLWGRFYESVSVVIYGQNLTRTQSHDFQLQRQRCKNFTTPRIA
jgi:hypothetical protein